MTWFKVDDHLHSHRKAMRAGTEAMGLWVLAGSWSAAEESDGWVPDYVLPRLVGANGVTLADRLVTAGLWEQGQVDGEDGYRFRGWGEYQPMRAQLEEKRERNAERMRRARSQGGDVRVHDEHTARAVTPTPTRPDPTNKSTPSRKRDEQPSDKAGDDFTRFWQLYPHKVGKQDAAKAWQQVLRQGAEVAAIAAGLRNAIDVWTAEGRVTGGRVVGRDHYVPHPATWLRAGRWEDEQPTAVDLPDQPAARPATARQCDGTEAHDRHPWNDDHNAYVCMGA